MTSYTSEKRLNATYRKMFSASLWRRVAETMKEIIGENAMNTKPTPVGPLSPPEDEPSLDMLLDEISDDDVAAWWQDAFNAMNGDGESEAHTIPLASLTDQLAAPLQRLYDEKNPDNLSHKAEALCIEMDMIARKSILRQKGYGVE